MEKRDEFAIRLYGENDTKQRKGRSTHLSRMLGPSDNKSHLPSRFLAHTPSPLSAFTNSNPQQIPPLPTNPHPKHLHQFRMFPFQSIEEGVYLEEGVVGGMVGGEEGWEGGPVCWGVGFGLSLCVGGRRWGRDGD